MKSVKLEGKPMRLIIFRCRLSPFHRPGHAFHAFAYDKDVRVIIKEGQLMVKAEALERRLGAGSIAFINVEKPRTFLNIYL